jgi:preprotein translocase subunit SecA
MNDQRKVVFEQRREMMAQESLEESIADMRSGVVDDLVAKHIPADAYPEAWDVAGLRDAIRGALNIDPPAADWAKEEGIADDEIRERLHQAANAAYAERVDKNTPEVMRYVEKQVVLQVLDHLWRDHLLTLDHLRQVIGWRGLAQRDPLNEYKAEAFELFNGLVTRLREIVTAQLMRIEVAFEPPPPQLPEMVAHHMDPMTGEDELALAGAEGRYAAASVETRLAPAAPRAPANRDPARPASWGKVGRNEVCPCGSGKKYKHCHGAI